MKNKNDITINDLVLELMSSSNGDLLIYEQCITLPVANQFQILEKGIKDAVESKNYVCAASLMRSLIETIMIIVYAFSIEKDNETEFYEMFMRTGRLQRWSKTKKKYENVRDEHLIIQFEKITNIKIRNTYDNLCNILHFSTSHMQMLIKGQVENGSATLVIGAQGPEVPKEAYESITKNISILKNLIKRILAEEIHRKRARNSEPLSETAQKFIDIGKMKIGNVK